MLKAFKSLMHCMDAFESENSCWFLVKCVGELVT